VFIRAPEAIVARGGGPTTIPACISKCHDTVAPILVEIQAQIDINADVDVFVGLFAEVVTALGILTTDLLAIVGTVGVFGGLTISACVTLFINLWLSIVVKIQLCVAILATVDFSVFLVVFVQICAALVANVNALISVSLLIVLNLTLSLVGVVGDLVALCVTLGASASVIASLNALL